MRAARSLNGNQVSVIPGQRGGLQMKLLGWPLAEYVERGWGADGDDADCSNDTPLELSAEDAAILGVELLVAAAGLGMDPKRFNDTFDELAKRLAPMVKLTDVTEDPGEPASPCDRAKRFFNFCFACGTTLTAGQMEVAELFYRKPPLFGSSTLIRLLAKFDAADSTRRDRT